MDAIDLIAGAFVLLLSLSVGVGIAFLLVFRRKVLKFFGNLFRFYKKIVLKKPKVSLALLFILSGIFLFTLHDLQTKPEFAKVKRSDNYRITRNKIPPTKSIKTKPIPAQPIKSNPEPPVTKVIIERVPIEPTAKRIRTGTLTWEDPIGKWKYTPKPIQVTITRMDHKLLLNYTCPGYFRIGIFVGKRQLDDSYKGRWAGEDSRKERKRDKRVGDFVLKKVSPSRFEGWTKENGDTIEYPFEITLKLR